MHKGYTRGSDTPVSGFTLLETIMSLALLLTVIMVMQGGQLKAKKGMDGVDLESAKSLIIERVHSTILNRNAWNLTMSKSENALINNHLTYNLTPTMDDNQALPPPAGQVLAVYDALGNVLVPIAGAKFLADSSLATPAQEVNAFFEMKIAWWKGKGHTATLGLTLKYIGKNEQAAGFQDSFVKIFKTPIKTSCIEITEPIVAGKSGLHNNYVSTVINVHTTYANDPGGNNFVWDHAVVQCPADYLLALVYTRAGCNALSTREYAIFSDPRKGSCHQISAQTATQMAGCAVGSNNGACVARCCTFE